jgi:glycosyltransferase involved in cell wall biosynthesis
MITVISCQHFPDDERVYHRELISLKKLGQSIRYYTRSDSEMDMSDELIAHKNFPAAEFSIPEYLNVLRKEFKVSPPTTLHIHEYHLLPLTRLTKRNYNSKVIYDVHEDLRVLSETFSTRHPSLRDLIISLRTHKERYYLKYVDQVVLINPIIKDCIFKDWGFDPLVLQGYPSKLSISDYPNDGCRGNTVLYHGHLGPERGIQELVESILILRNTIPDVSLILLGSFRLQKFQDDILSTIKDNKLSDNIKWVAQVPHQDVWTYLNKAAVGVIPFRQNSLFMNCTPTKLFEFMAAGCGIVASDLPPIHHHVDESIQWSCPGSAQSIAEGLIKLLQNPRLLENQVRKNQSLILNQYNWESISNKLITLYKRLL